MDPPVAIERRGVPYLGAPVRGRAPLKSGWQVLLENKGEFMAVIEKSKQDNKNLMTRMSPSAQRKQRSAVDNWFNLLNALDPDLDKERCWETEIVESHGMHMVPVLVRTPYTYIYISSSFSSARLPKARARRTTGSSLRVHCLKMQCSSLMGSAALVVIRKRNSWLGQS